MHYKTVGAGRGFYNVHYCIILNRLVKTEEPEKVKDLIEDTLNKKPLYLNSDFLFILAGLQNDPFSYI